MISFGFNVLYIWTINLIYKRKKKKNLTFGCVDKLANSWVVG